MVLACSHPCGSTPESGSRSAPTTPSPGTRPAVVTAWFMAQSLFNLAVVLACCPWAGVPLPMLSYGGRP